MSETLIRTADWRNPVDCAAVLELIDAYAREPIEGGQPLPDDTQERLIDGLRAEPGAFVLLAFVDGRAVGVAVCFRSFSTFSARPLINLHDLAVLPEYRDQGIGSLLLDDLSHRAREVGCCKITLEVRETNEAAQRLYQRHGFGVPSGKPTRFLDKPL